MEQITLCWVILNNRYYYITVFVAQEFWSTVASLGGSGPGSLQGTALRMEAGMFDSCLNIHFPETPPHGCWQKASVPR